MLTLINTNHISMYKKDVKFTGQQERIHYHVRFQPTSHVLFSAYTYISGFNQHVSCQVSTYIFRVRFQPTRVTSGFNQHALYQVSTAMQCVGFQPKHVMSRHVRFQLACQVSTSMSGFNEWETFHVSRNFDVSEVLVHSRLSPLDISIICNINKTIFIDEFMQTVT